MEKSCEFNLDFGMTTKQYDQSWVEIRKRQGIPSKGYTHLVHPLPMVCLIVDLLGISQSVLKAFGKNPNGPIWKKITNP